MTTLAEMVTRTKQYLYGFSQDQQQWSYLTSAISSSDLTWAVNDASQISRGEVEIDGAETCLVQAVNRVGANTVTIYPFGRGWAGSTATSHLGNARIENNPVFPSQRVKEAINDAIRSVYPDLYVVSTAKLTKLSVKYQYALPADAEEVISLKYQLIGPSMIYPPVRRWRFEGQADSTDFPTLRAIEVLEEVTPGREIYAVYRKQPTELVNDTDDFAGVTGLPSTVQDVIVYAACMKLSPALEGPRLILDAAEASERGGQVPPGSAAKVSSYFGQLYKERLMQEKQKLVDRYPIRSHFDS